MTDEHLAHSIRHGPKHILSKSENIFSCILLEHIERGGGGRHLMNLGTTICLINNILTFITKNVGRSFWF